MNLKTTILASTNSYLKVIQRCNTATEKPQLKLKLVPQNSNWEEEQQQQWLYGNNKTRVATSWAT